MDPIIWIRLEYRDRKNNVKEVQTAGIEPLGAMRAAFNRVKF
jgi:hypothetical protein